MANANMRAHMPRHAVLNKITCHLYMPYGYAIFWNRYRNLSQAKCSILWTAYIFSKTFSQGIFFLPVYIKKQFRDPNVIWHIIWPIYNILYGWYLIACISYVHIKCLSIWISLKARRLMAQKNNWSEINGFNFKWFQANFAWARVQVVL